MTAALALVAFMIIASTAGAAALRRAAWTRAAPRWGIVAWQSLSASVVLAGVLGALALALCMLPLRTNVADLVGLTPLEVARHYEPPTGDWLGLLALAVATATVATLLGRILTNLHRAARGRRTQVDALALVGHDHPDGFTVVTHPTPVVYCIPGRARKIVVSTGALALLSEQEMTLVLGHERTHLRARHDLALAASDALAWTFSRFRLFQDAHEQIAVLVEMQADDAAHAVPDRRTLARALISLSAGQSPGATLAAGDTAALARVRRLTSSTSRPLRPRHKALVGLCAVAAFSAPLGLALAPALEASASQCCAVR